MTAIENALFRDATAHWVAAFEIVGDNIAVTLHPCARPDLRIHARFARAKILSVDDSYAEDAERMLPWDIIGFDSDPLGQGRWRYCLHTSAIEYCFEADWPAVEVASSKPS